MISEMQKRMQEMREELFKLRAAVGTTKKHEASVSQSAPNRQHLAVMTFEEKKNLITQIHKLPSKKVEKVVEIIQAGMPPNRKDDSEEEVEIPIDDLDEATLRRLQVI